MCQCLYVSMFVSLSISDLECSSKIKPFKPMWSFWYIIIPLDEFNRNLYSITFNNRNNLQGTELCTFFSKKFKSQWNRQKFWTKLHQHWLCSRSSVYTSGCLTFLFVIESQRKSCNLMLEYCITFQRGPTHWILRNKQRISTLFSYW